MMQLGHNANPYLSVTIGSEVYTSDSRRIGAVSEIRGRYFRIKRPWWQRNYWLRTDCVRSSTPGDRVVLNVDSDHLEESRMSDDPPRE
jgi:hypothetical protein